MESIYLLILVGFFIGTCGTLIGAGGGFILVPLLILFHPELSAEEISALSMAVVACNAVSGTIAYAFNKRIDYQAGFYFAAATLPGSILGVMTTSILSRGIFDLIFGFVLVGLAVLVYWKSGNSFSATSTTENPQSGLLFRKLTDKSGETFTYSYNLKKGAFLSVLVGYFSPLFGIGGGIIHVPAMVQWLKFPVHIATATSHFILAIMAAVSVIAHYFSGSYENAALQTMAFGLIIGVIPGAQLGAFLSRRLKGKFIIKALAIAIGLVGVRIFASRIFEF